MRIDARSCEKFTTTSLFPAIARAPRWPGAFRPPHRRSSPLTRQTQALAGVKAPTQSTSTLPVSSLGVSPTTETERTALFATPKVTSRVSMYPKPTQSSDAPAPPPSTILAS